MIGTSRQRSVAGQLGGVFVTIIVTMAKDFL